MSTKFTPELKNTSSPAFKSLKKDVEDNLGREIKKNMPAVDKIDVYQFRSGSTVADYNIIVTDAKAAETLNASSVQSAVNTAITSGNLSASLAVNKTYLPSVEDVVIVYATTAAPITVAATTVKVTTGPSTAPPTTPEAVQVAPVPACTEVASTCQSPAKGGQAKCVSGSCRCPIGYTNQGGRCTDGSIVALNNVVLQGQAWNSDFKDTSSAAFVNFAKGFEYNMMKFIKASVGTTVLGVQVTGASEGSTIVSALVITDKTAPAINGSLLATKLQKDAFNLNRYLGSYNVDTSKPPTSKVAHGCTLTTSACGADFNCLPKLPGMDFECVCKKNDDDQCITDALDNWKIAVIVVAVFVFLLMVIIIVAIVRMYRRRHYTGKAYVSEHGRDNVGANLS